MEEEISLVEMFNILKKRFGMIACFSLFGLIIASIFTFFIATPMYNSTTQLLVNRTQTNEVIQQSDINTNVQLINTYKDIIKGPVILNDAREILDIDSTQSSLSSQIEITSENNSQVFSLTVTDSNPYSAANIANTVASIFQEKIDEIMNVDNVTIISEAVPNINHISPNTSLNLVIGFILGIVLGVGAAFLLEFLDKSVKEDKFIVEDLNWTNLGKISEMSSDELESDDRVSEVQLPNETRSARGRV